MNFNLFNEISSNIKSSLNFPVRQPLTIGHNSNHNTDIDSNIVDEPNVTTFNDVLNTFISNPPENLDQEIADAIASASAQYELDPNLIRAVIRAESSYNPNAVSSAGAMGLMQLMPVTANGLGVTDPFDIHQNVHGGARYLRQMLDRFDNDLELALAAYNAGAGNVERFGGIPPFRETQNYIPRVQRHKQNYLMEQYKSNNRTDI